MTELDFKEAFMSGRCIRCRDMDERRTALLYLQSIGYVLKGRRLNYLEQDCTDDNYLHPLVDGGKDVCCTCREPQADDIPFDVVAELIGGSYCMDIGEELAPLATLLM